MKDITVNYTYTKVPGYQYLVKEFWFNIKLVIILISWYLVLNVLEMKITSLYVWIQYKHVHSSCVLLYDMFVDILDNFFSSCSTDRNYECYNSQPL